MHTSCLFLSGRPREREQDDLKRPPGEEKGGFFFFQGTSCAFPPSRPSDVLCLSVPLAPGCVGVCVQESHGHGPSGFPRRKR